MRIKSLLSIALLIAVIFLAFPTVAFASDEHTCAHAPTVQSLRDCVVHAGEAGHIDNRGITQSLVAMLDAAQKAQDLGQTDVAINNLQAFIQHVEAQAGKHIHAEHAAHMVVHANEVIAALSQ